MHRINEMTTLLNEAREEYLVSKGYRRSKENQANSPQAIRDLINDVFNAESQPNEKVYLLCLDKKYMVNGVFELTSGLVDRSVLSTRDIFKNALMAGACCIALAHNHPTGDPTPSGQDRAATKKVCEAGQILDLPLVDHVIIGSQGRYYSFREEEDGLFKQD